MWFKVLHPKWTSTFFSLVDLFYLNCASSYNSTSKSIFFQSYCLLVSICLPKPISFTFGAWWVLILHSDMRWQFCHIWKNVQKQDVHMHTSTSLRWWLCCPTKANAVTRPTWKVRGKSVNFDFVFESSLWLLSQNMPESAGVGGISWTSSLERR